MTAIASTPNYSLRRVAVGLLIAAIVVNFIVSSMALSFIGFNYDSASGAIWQKLHPSTYLAALAMVANILSQAKPIDYVKSRFIEFPGVAYFIVILLPFLTFAIMVQKAPITTFIDPYAIAIVALLMYGDMPASSREKVRALLHMILIVNALVGVIEFVTQWRLFPYMISGEEIFGDSRSTALLGHPLLNAATTGAYLLCLFLGGDPKISTPLRCMFIGVSALGLIAFGGRTAIMASSLIVIGKSAYDFAYILLGARVDIRRVLGILFIVPLICGAAIGAAYAGLFDALVDRFIDDNGSGEARLIMMRLFDMFDFGDLLMGPRPDVLDSTLKSLGIEIGIENTWLALTFAYGAWMAGFFILSLFVLFWEYWRRSRPGATLLFVYFLIIISAVIGLASKTMSFAQFSILLLFLFDGADENETAAGSCRAPCAPEPRLSLIRV